jgi:hypothetical protein
MNPPPYLHTTHTWSCTKGHELVIKDEGRPQTPGLKARVLAAWAAWANKTCPTCGAKSGYSASEEGADLE